MDKAIRLDDIAIEESELLLFAVVQGVKQGLKENDIVTINRDGRDVEYLIIKINYESEKIFNAVMVFNKFTEDDFFCINGSGELHI